MCTDPHKVVALSIYQRETGANQMPKKKIICQKLIAVSLLLLQVTKDNQNENKGTQIESCKSPQTTRATAQSNLCYRILLQAP